MARSMQRSMRHGKQIQKRERNKKSYCFEEPRNCQFRSMKSKYIGKG
jgi:hypothetical protein